MHTIVQHLPADLLLPPGLGYALLEQLLLPASVLQQEVAHLQQPQRVLGLWTQQQQQSSMQVSLCGCAGCCDALCHWLGAGDSRAMVQDQSRYSCGCCISCSYKHLQ
jgi:hypothetical protein